MEKLFNELLEMAKINKLTARRDKNFLKVCGWEFQLQDLCRHIRQCGIELKEFSFGGSYRTLTAEKDNYFINLLIL